MEESKALLTELLSEVRTLNERIGNLEEQLADVKRQVDEDIPEDVVMAISAAVAAFLGHKARIKHIHYRRGQAWAQQGRVAVQGRHFPRGAR